MPSVPPAVGPVSAAAGAARPPAFLLCRARPGVTLTFDLKADESLLGRDPSMPVALPLDGVSRQHARIRWDGEAFWLEDLKSTNGTLLNGQRLVRERLRHLDVITLGRTADVIFVMRATDPGPVRRYGIVSASVTAEAPDALPHEIGPGEVTLGRSLACNVVAEHAAVSKLHVRIVRTADALVLEDLGSSNGTFVNGERVMTAVLHDDDLIHLAGVEPYRVEIEMGEVASASGAHRPLPAGGGDKPRFSRDWQTRFEWSSGEREVIASLHLDAAAQPAEPAAPRPTPPPAPSAAPPAPSAAPPESETGAATIVATAPEPPSTPIAEVRLAGGGYDLAVTAPGTYVIGRSRDATLQVKHRTVSRRQAHIVLSEDRRALRLEHAGGANRTRLNGRLIEQVETVADGDEIGIGEVTLRVSLKRGPDGTSS